MQREEKTERPPDRIVRERLLPSSPLQSPSHFYGESSVVDHELREILESSERTFVQEQRERQRVKLFREKSGFLLSRLRFLSAKEPEALLLQQWIEYHCEYHPPDSIGEKICPTHIQHVKEWLDRKQNQKLRSLFLTLLQHQTNE